MARLQESLDAEWQREQRGASWARYIQSSSRGDEFSTTGARSRWGKPETRPQRETIGQTAAHTLLFQRGPNFYFAWDIVRTVLVHVDNRTTKAPVVREKVKLVHRLLSPRAAKQFQEMVRLLLVVKGKDFQDTILYASGFLMVEGEWC